MRKWSLEVDDASHTAAEVGLENGVYNVMLYDTMVCRRGMLRPGPFAKLLSQKFRKWVKDSDMLGEIKKYVLCFFPETGIQVDYSTGFHISPEAMPEEAKRWTKRKEAWPSKDLMAKVMTKGAVLVPKTFKDDDKNEKSRRWRINFDLNEILNDPTYSERLDPRRILIILKDMKNMISSKLP